MKMTKELREKCLNKLGQAFCYLDKDTQGALNELRMSSDVEILHDGCRWTTIGRGTCDGDRVYRVSDSYKFVEERETVDYRLSEYYFCGYSVWYLFDFQLFLSAAPAIVGFVGIGYEKDGEITLRTSVDAAFGTPKFVRLYKDAAK